MSDYTVRIRFRLPSRERIGIDSEACAYHPDRLPEVTLHPAGEGQAVRGADWLILRSEGWPSEEEAESGAELLEDALRMALARFGMSADLGRRAPGSGFFRAGLKMLEGMTGRPTLNDEHGPIVFPTEANPMFARVGTPTLIRTMQPERWEKAFLYALNSGHELSEPERVAFDLYCGAFLTSSVPDARFALLFAAFEALIEKGSRSDAAVEHVDSLIQATKDADLAEAEKRSLVGTLEWLRFDSIRGSGRQFVRERLGGREYGKRPAEKFFLDCYDMRNRLLHGNLPFPTRDEVDGLAAPLEKMVGHLIAGPVLELDV